MKNLILLSIGMLMIGCGSTESYIEPEVAPQFGAFLKEANSYGVYPETDNLIIEFGELPFNRAGRCKQETMRYIDGDFTQKTIILNKEFWDKSTDAAREFVVFHELGHCLMGRGHDMGDRPLVWLQVRGQRQQVSITPSLMSPATNSGLDDEIYGQVREYFIEEMFLGRKDLLSQLTSQEKLYQSVNKEESVSERSEDDYECDHLIH